MEIYIVGFIASCVASYIVVDTMVKTRETNKKYMRKSK